VQDHPKAVGAAVDLTVYLESGLQRTLGE